MFDDTAILILQILTVVTGVFIVLGLPLIETIFKK